MANLKIYNPDGIEHGRSDEERVDWLASLLYALASFLENPFRRDLW
jgi:hypothetical protein